MAEAAVEVSTKRPARCRGTNAGRAPVPLSGAPEFRLLCRALRRPLRPDDLAFLRQGLAASPDWRRLLEGVRRHRVAPLLLEAVQACRSPDLPPAALADLRGDARAAATGSLAQAREVARLARLFAQAGIAMLALKGVVLSMQLYGDPALRHPRDIDLLVSPEAFELAETLLLREGYRRDGPGLSRRQEAARRRWVKDAGYLHEATGIQVELHHRLSDNPALLPLDFAALWRERDTIEIAGAVVATLPRRYLALYLALHGAGHCWEELRWLVDLAAALPDAGAAGSALAEAEAHGLAAPMLHALALAQRWLGLPLGEALLAGALANRHVRRLDRVLAPSYAPAAWYRTPPREGAAVFLR